VTIQVLLPGTRPVPSPTLHYYAGYTWGMPVGDTAPWCAGVVITPRWLKRFAGEGCHLPVILDNGAWPAYAAGRVPDFGAQLEGLHEGIEALGEQLEWVIAPDVVGDAGASWSRTLSSLTCLWEQRGRLLLPVQDGSCLRDYVTLAREEGDGIFVGGSTKEVKRRMVERIRAIDSSVYVHVGRISRERELMHAAEHAVDSFDTTTFMRRQDANRAIAWRPRFQRWVRREA